MKKKDKRSTFKEKLDDLINHPLLLGPVVGITLLLALGSLIVDAIKPKKTKK